MAVIYDGDEIIVFAFHRSGIAQALEEAAGVVREEQGRVIEEQVTLDTNGRKARRESGSFEITLPVRPYR